MQDSIHMARQYAQRLDDVLDQQARITAFEELPPDDWDSRKEQARRLVNLYQHDLTILKRLQIGLDLDVNDREVVEVREHLERCRRVTAAFGPATTSVDETPLETEFTEIVYSVAALLRLSQRHADAPKIKNLPVWNSYTQVMKPAFLAFRRRQLSEAEMVPLRAAVEALQKMFGPAEIPA